MHQFVSSAQSLIRTTNEALRYSVGSADKSTNVASGDHNNGSSEINGHVHKNDKNGKVKAEKDVTVISTDAFLANTSEPLSQSVLNRLRLILVWTCEGNITLI